MWTFVDGVVTLVRGIDRRAVTVAIRDVPKHGSSRALAVVVVVVVVCVLGG